MTSLVLLVLLLSENSQVAIASDGVGMRINSLFRVAGLSLQVYAIDILEQDSDPITLHN